MGQEGAGVAGVDRPAVSAPPSAQPGPPGGYEGRQAVEAVWRIESARIVGAPCPIHGRLRDGGGPRPGGARRGAGLVAARRLTPQPRRLAAHRRPAPGHRRVPAAFGARPEVRRDGGRPGEGQGMGSAPRGGGRRALRPRADRRRRPRPDLHLLPPGAVAGGERRPHPARARRPDQRRDRARLPHPDRDGAGPDHPRQEDAGCGAGALRGAAARRAPAAAQRRSQRRST